MPRHLGTALVATLCVLVGFVGGATGAAWFQRDGRAQPWRKLHVEAEGTKGTTTRTRVVFDNPALSVQALEVTRSPEGSPDLARVVLRDGRELTVKYVGDNRPTSIEAPDGSRAALSYEGGKANVEIFGPDKKTLGQKAVTVPSDVRYWLPAGKTEPRQAHSELWHELCDALIPEARAQEAADTAVPVVRHVEIGLDVRTPGVTGATASAQVEASCAPFTCVPVTSEVPMPGQSTVRVAVTGSVKKSTLKKPADPSAVEPFKKIASAERTQARRSLPDAAGVVGAVGVTALACKSLKLAAQVCVAELGKTGAAGGAAYAVASYDISTSGRIVDARAEELYYVEQARAALDKPAKVQVCVFREGWARTCTEVEGRPLGPEPMARVDRALDLKKGIGGTLVGSFAMTQKDGPDCKFSPSPQTSGALRLTFDNDKATMTGAAHAEQRGSRPDLRCSLGTANMAWSQNYNISVSQTFTPQQLQSGGKLPLRAPGTMNGVGQFSFSNCRTSGGASAGCPGGKNDGYSYTVELVGEIDMATQTGTGTIVVSNAPLETSGTWRVPAGPK